MGKVDDLRKMREARYEAQQRPQPRTAVARNTQVRATDVDDNKGASFMCGHKGVSGKSCTRPKDHEEKNHRYK